MKIKTSVLIIAIIINIILSVCIYYNQISSHKINVRQSKPVVSMCYMQETIEQAEERLQMCIAR